MGERAEYDVLIAGGGLVGASLACALGALPLRIGVVEGVPYRSAHQPSFDDRVTALSFGSRRILDALDLWPAVAGGGATAIERIHVSDRGHFGKVRMDARQAGVEALGYVVENRVLGAALEQGLAQRPGVELICPARVVAVSEQADAMGVTVRVGEQERALTTRLLVAADGGQSAVRDLLGMATVRAGYGQSAVIANVLPEKAHGGLAFERFTDSGPLALLPMSEGRCSLVWTVRDQAVEAMQAWSEELFLERLQQRFGDRLGRFLKVGARHVYPLGLVFARESVRARVAIIGNAAHTVHPVAGQGLNLGLRDVAALAQVVADAVRAGADPGGRAVLDHYARWRRRDQLQVAGFTDGLVRLFSNGLPPLVVARNVGLLATDLLPPLKHLLVRHATGLAGHLPRLARGLPL